MDIQTETGHVFNDCIFHFNFSDDMEKKYRIYTGLDFNGKLVGFVTPSFLMNNSKLEDLKKEISKALKDRRD